jgi:hypothetical protein
MLRFHFGMAQQSAAHSTAELQCALSFQIVSIDAPASGVVLAGSARLREASRLLVTKKKKNGLAPLSRFQHDGVRDAITETLFLV